MTVEKQCRQVRFSATCGADLTDCDLNTDICCLKTIQIGVLCHMLSEAMALCVCVCVCVFVLCFECLFLVIEGHSLFFHLPLHQHCWIIQPQWFSPYVGMEMGHYAAVLHLKPDTPRWLGAVEDDSWTTFLKQHNLHSPSCHFPALSYLHHFIPSSTPPL